MSCDRLLYCHCTYAKVVPAEVRNEVLERLGASGVAFEAVPDLCEMSARKDPALLDLRGREPGTKLRIAACYPRAVRWLFHAGGAPLEEGTFEIHNMREHSAGEVVAGLFGEGGPPSP